MKPLDEIKARCEAATAGPWGWDWGDGSMPTLHGIDPDRDVVLAAKVCEACYVKGGGCMSPGASDATFIAASRQDVPRLVKALEYAVEMLAEEMDTMLDEQDAEDAVEDYKDNIAAILAGKG